MYDWNAATVPSWRGSHAVLVVDETLRDGLQNATAIDPPLDDKLELLRLMRAVGVDVVSIGLPAASGRSIDQAVAMARFIASERLALRPTAAARTVARDVEAVAEVAQKSGVLVEVYAFIGSSPIRHFTESWDVAFLTRHIEEATAVARKQGIPFCLVTEDTTRAQPRMLETLFKCALDGGAVRLCLCDTVGHATPDGVARLVRFTKDLLTGSGHGEVGLDWHAHNDRGLGLQTAIWASELGVDRIHGTALGIGERVGNVPLELLVLNLGLLGSKRSPTREALRRYCEKAVSALGIGAIPDTHPLFGRAANRVLDEAGATAAAPKERDVAAREPLAEASPAQRKDSPASGLECRPAPLELTVNGDRRRLAVVPSRTLLELLRYDLDLYGTKQGCDKGDCGACTVRVDGEPVLSCLTLALACEGRSVETIEAMPGNEDLHPLLDAFDRTGAAQCGFCTPGFLVTAWSLLDKNPNPSRDQIKHAISSNLCRCTGYGSIVDAIELASQMIRGKEPRMVGLPGRDDLPGPIDDPQIGRPEKS